MQQMKLLATRSVISFSATTSAHEQDDELDKLKARVAAEIAAIKANLEHTKTKKGVDLDPSYNEDRAVKQMKQAERAQKLGYKSVM